MDLSLHSFILVVGLVVMAFILWDGIKKVKLSRANKLRIKLDDQLDNMPVDTDGFGSEFPNGGARQLDESDGLNFNSDKFDELEFDETLVAEEALHASHEDDETYVSADLIHDVENELEQMDAIDGESSIVQPEHTSQAVEAEETASVTAKATTKAEPIISSDVFDTSELLNSQVSSEPRFQPDSQTHPQQDIKDAVQALAEPPMEFMMPASTLDKSKENQTERPAVTKTESVESKSDVKKEAEAKAKKLKAELDKISAAKKQLAAQKAYDDAVSQKQDEEVLGTANIPEADSSASAESPVPMLMEPVELGDTIDPNPPEQKELTLPDQPEEAETVPEMESFSAIDDVDSFSAEIDPLMDDVPDGLVKATEHVGESLKDRPAPQEVLVINVLKDHDEPLKGADLHHIFNVCDLRHGEMGIYHRFEQANAKGKIQFSVANAVEPGTFDMATIETMTTTGISFFMSLPGPEHPMDAFDAMVEVAHVFARNFNAELHDESHSDLTPQTIEHSRNRIREFCRKQKMSMAPA